LRAVEAGRAVAPVARARDRQQEQAREQREATPGGGHEGHTKHDAAVVDNTVRVERNGIARIATPIEE
jgi:hypothetical protein